MEDENNDVTSYLVLLSGAVIHGVVGPLESRESRHAVPRRGAKANPLKEWSTKWKSAKENKSGHNVALYKLVISHV